MTTPNPKKSAQDGRVLILVLIFMLTLSALWIIALSMTGSEMSFVGGRKTASQRFYDAEAGVASVVDNLDTLLPSEDMAVTDVIGPIDVKDPDSDPNPANQRAIARVTVRPVQSEDTALANSNNLPVQAHKIKGGCNPEKPSGQTVWKEFYGVDSVSAGREIQVGICREVLVDQNSQ